MLTASRMVRLVVGSTVAMLLVACGKQTPAATGARPTPTHRHQCTAPVGAASAGKELNSDLDGDGLTDHVVVSDSASGGMRQAVLTVRLGEGGVLQRRFNASGSAPAYALTTVQTGVKNDAAIAVRTDLFADAAVAHLFWVDEAKCQLPEVTFTGKPVDLAFGGGLKEALSVDCLVTGNRTSIVVRHLAQNAAGHFVGTAKTLDWAGHTLKLTSSVTEDDGAASEPKFGRFVCGADSIPPG